jgi:hypothetical protein
MFTLASPPARACDFAPFEAGTGVAARSSNDLPPVPRNVAFLWQQIPVESALPAEGVTVAEGPGAAIVAQPLLDASSRFSTYLVRPSEPLEPNIAFSVYRYGSLAEQYRTGDYLDETPPERPVVSSGALSFHDGTQGCAQDSCGDYTSLSFELERPVSDDHARPDDMVYVLYLGESEAEVRAGGAPYAFLSTFSLNVEDGWVDKDAFMAVSALDHAGNESERSEPFRVNASTSEGCSVQSRSTRRVSASLFLVAFAFALLRRVGRR